MVAIPNARHQGFGGRIMEILGLLPYAIVTCVLQTSLYTTLTGPLVTYDMSAPDTAGFERTYHM